MPKKLLARCQPDSIRQFRDAASRRFDDGLALASAGQSTGAIYLWGYTAEMTIKAAYFSSVGLPERDAITWSGHLRPAISMGRTSGINWPPQGEGHNVRAWAQLLIAERDKTPATAYASPFRLRVEWHSQRIEPLWRESLRYRRNAAYAHEVEQMREAAEWFLVNSLVL